MSCLITPYMTTDKINQGSNMKKIYLTTGDYIWICGKFISRYDDKDTSNYKNLYFQGSRQYVPSIHMADFEVQEDLSVMTKLVNCLYTSRCKSN